MTLSKKVMNAILPGTDLMVAITVVPLPLSTPKNIYPRAFTIRGFTTGAPHTRTT